MSKPIEITATVAVWLPNYSRRDFQSILERGNSLRIIDALQFYGPPDKKDFSDYVRVGEADITVRLIPKDEQTRLMVQALQKQLTEERVKWHERQEAILAEISKLSALEYVEAAS
jgi:hypothetical protein